MEKEKIIEIINENNDSIFLTGGVSVEQIGDIENNLNVILPDSYKWFLKQYGEGILLGIEIYGAGAKETNIPSCVKFTEKSREDDNLPKEYVMIEELGELAYCIDTSIFQNNECPIVSWDPINEEVGEEKFDDFYKYLYYRLDEMLD
ncbi:SMI1/KNR4 family protein [Peribacillus frigoritolerans]|uniref:SMI1/KNR4 family protein n=1 Tax=Peribacillus castrilensis TaxID=2897690 RepID=UPI003DA3AEED